MLSVGSVSPVVTPSVWRCNSRLRKANSLARPLDVYPKACTFSYGAGLCRKQQFHCCSSDGEQGKEEEGGQGGWSVEEQVERMLADEESKALIQDLNAAVERVAKARRDLDTLEEQQRRAAILENIESADSLVEDCQRSVFAAEVDVRNAQIALVKARAGSSFMDIESEGGDNIDRDAERVESVKGAGVSGVVGTLAGLPFFAAANSGGVELAVSAGAVFVSCAVFGLTYRYAVRRDLSNVQLKAGCVAAFALVRSLGQLDVVRLLEAFSFSGQDAARQLIQGCLVAAESIAVFSFAAVSLEYCFQQGLVSPFPSKQQ